MPIITIILMRNNDDDALLKDISEKLCTLKYDKNFINSKCIKELSIILNNNPEISESKLKEYGICEKLRKIETLFVFNVNDALFHPLILKNLYNVRNLTISSDGKYCQTLSNIDFVKSFSKLNRLTIHHVALTDSNSLNAISNLQHLKSLDMQDCQLENLSPISSMKSLTHIRCNSNNIQEFPIMPYVRKLIAYDNPLRNIDSLKEAKNLEYLSISRCGLNDISALANLTKLHSIYCVRNKITDISFIDSLHQLKTFIADDNLIASLDIYSTNINLKTLSLRNNKITNIHNIINFPNLTFLSLDKNAIIDIEPISQLHQLKHLQLKNNLINNIDNTKNLHNLQTLDISENPRLILNKFNENVKSIKM